MLSPTALGVILSVASPISAHGYIDKLHIGGTDYPGFNPTTAPWVPDQGTITWPAWNTDLGPVYSNALANPDIICSINATNAKIYSTSVAAGDSVDLHWTTWPVSHHGPILTYLAACNGECTAVKKEELKWFKIEEVGQLALGSGGGKAGVWADDQLRDANGDWSVKIPSSIKAGNYVLRHEIVALHSAYAVGGAQFYPQCVNVKITGGGSAEPEGVVGTELYAAEDPGVLYNIYNDEAMPVYQIPGPKLFTA